MISETVRHRVQEQAQERCGYCLTQQQYVPWTLEIEHLTPTSKGGTDEESNLWLACRSCNLYKGAHIQGHDAMTDQFVALFNPRIQKWSDHFEWSQDGTLILGRTDCGRATITRLNLNHVIVVTVRHNWVLAGWHPPST